MKKRDSKLTTISKIPTLNNPLSVDEFRTLVDKAINKDLKQWGKRIKLATETENNMEITEA